VFVKTYGIIYELIDQVSEALDSLIETEKQEVISGEGKIIARFELNDGTLIAGTLIEDGQMKKNKTGRIIRGKEIIGEGRITSLKQAKEEVSISNKGVEVGINLEPQVDFQVGDKLVCVEEGKK